MTTKTLTDADSSPFTIPNAAGALCYGFTNFRLTGGGGAGSKTAAGGGGGGAGADASISSFVPSIPGSTCAFTLPAGGIGGSGAGGNPGVSAINSSFTLPNGETIVAACGHGCSSKAGNVGAGGLASASTGSAIFPTTLSSGGSGAVGGSNLGGGGGGCGTKDGAGVTATTQTGANDGSGVKAGGDGGNDASPGAVATANGGGGGGGGNGGNGGSGGPGQAVLTYTLLANGLAVHGAQPGSTPVNMTLAPITVRATDTGTDGGNVLNDSSTAVTVALSGTIPAGAILSGTNPVTLSAGSATFSDLSINKVGNGVSLKFYTGDGLPGAIGLVTTNTFNSTYANTAVFTTGPANKSQNAGQTIIVKATSDGTVGGTLDSSLNSNCTLSLATGSGNLTADNLTVAFVAGVATFTNVALDTTGDIFTLTVTPADTTVGPGTSAIFHISSTARFTRGCDDQHLAIPIIPSSLDPVAALASTNGMTDGMSYVANRIPVRMVTTTGDHLQFFEARETGVNDNQASSIFMARSVNDGQSWNPLQLIFRRSDYNGTNGAGNKWLNNGSAGLHTGTGRLHYIWSQSDIVVATRIMTMWYMGSDDNGVTWGGSLDGNGAIIGNGVPREITASTIKFDNTHFVANGGAGSQSQGPLVTSVLPDGASLPTAFTAGFYSQPAAWTYNSVGPGTMVCIQKQGAYRQRGWMICPVYSRYTVNDHSFSRLIYSPDNGANWYAGGGFVETGANTDSNECFCVEIGVVGSLYLNCRIVNVNNRGQVGSPIMDVTANFADRVLMTTDGGAGTIAASDCQGSGCKGTNILDVFVVAPADGSNSSNRTVLKIWKSMDGGNSFPYSKILSYEHVGYSSVVFDQDNPTPDIHISHEVTYNAGGDNASYQYITQTILTQDFVLDTSESTLPQIDYLLNEAASGAISTLGTPILDHGRADNGYLWDNRGQGGAAGTYTATGIAADGTGVAAILQFKQDGVIGGAFDMGGASYTEELIGFATVSGGSGLVIRDNRNNSGQGWTLSLNASNQLVLNVSDGTHTATATGATDIHGATKHNIKLERTATAITIYIAPTNTNAYVSDGTAASSTTTTIVGTQNGVFGSNANGTSGCACSIDRVRATHGIPTIGLLTGLEVKQTAAAFKNNVIALPSALPSLTGCVLMLNDPFTGGLGGVDGGGNTNFATAGAWDNNFVPAVNGTAIHCCRNRQKLSEMWQIPSSARGAYWDTDSYVGRHLRIGRLTGQSTTSYFTTSTAQGYTLNPSPLDFLQTTGSFSMIWIVKFVADIGTTQFFMENVSGSSANAGIYFYRGDVTGVPTFQIFNGAGGTLVSTNFTANVNHPAFLAGNWYFIGIAGRGTGVPVDCYYGTYGLGKVAPNLLKAQSANMGALSAVASIVPPTIWALNNGAGGANVRAIGPIIYNSASASPATDPMTTVGSDAWFQAWENSIVSQNSSLNRISLGIAIGV